ncbi:MAG: hypothetical protein AB7I59_07615 [Geminicoccaceae bacterium]
MAVIASPCGVSMLASCGRPIASMDHEQIENTCHYSASRRWATTLISTSKPAGQFTPDAAQAG